MAIERPRDYLNNANLLREITLSQEIHKKRSDKIHQKMTEALSKKRMGEDKLQKPSDEVIKLRIIEDGGCAKKIAAEQQAVAIECLTPTLVKMIMELIYNYATSWRWRGYTWIDDMQADAALNLCRVALKFNREKAGKYPNPFGYYTQITKRVFLTYISNEKKQGKIRDSIIEMSDTDLLPSFGRQNEEVGNSLDLDLDGTKTVESNPMLRRRRKKPKVLPEDDISKMDDVEYKNWLTKKTEEFMKTNGQKVNN